MRFQARTFWLTKDAEATDQYQDSFDVDAQRGVAAIADGVTSAIFSGPWARLLTRAVVTDPPQVKNQEALGQWLAKRREEWLAGIDTSRLTWYQKPKLAEGGQATLLWVEVSPKENGKPTTNGAAAYTMRCYAIGDCCLFHQHAGRVLSVFPLGTSADFAANPLVVGSSTRRAEDLPQFQWMETDCRAGDLLVLATDALALWAVAAWENNQPVDWQRYWELSEDQWREEIFTLRQEKQIRYDDTTLVLLRVQ